MLRSIGLALVVCASLVTTACAGNVLTPERCEVAMNAADTVQDIAAVLIARGVEPERAAAVARAVAVGQIALGAACAAAGVGGGTTAGLAPASASIPAAPS